MPEAPDNIIGKVKKLLALGEEGRGGTDAERELAMERAQQLMHKWNLDMATVQTEHGGDARGEVDKKSAFSTNKRSQWQGALLNVVSHYNFCTVIYISYGGSTGRKDWTVIGRPENVQFVMELWQFIVDQLQTEVKGALAQYRYSAPPDKKINPNAFRRAFYDGAVDRIRHRLSEQQAKRTASTGMELVVSEHAELQRYLKDQFPNTREQKPKPKPRNLAGRISGDRAGARADLFPGRKLGD